jgi:hypothetical protein
MGIADGLPRVQGTKHIPGSAICKLGRLIVTRLFDAAAVLDS